MKVYRARLATAFLCIPLVLSAQTLPSALEQSGGSDLTPQSSESLPSLMSLAQSLELIDARHPEVLRHNARVQAGEAAQVRSGLDKRWKANIELTARTADLQNLDRGYEDDSRALLKISKLIWDFGQSGDVDEIGDIGVERAEIGLEYARRLQRIQVIRRYFEVLAADYRFAADNEAMSLAFFPFNRAQEKQARYDSISELEVMKNRVDYFDELTRRNQSRSEQRASRLRLALAMGRPQARPDSLIEPDLSAYEREVPDFDLLLEQALAVSPAIKQRKLEIAQLKSEQTLINSGEMPNLTFDVQAAKYVQDYRFRDRGRASLTLNIPLFAGNVTAIEQAELLAEISAREAELLATDYEIREQVMEWVQELEILNQQIRQNALNLEYRERALDKSRLLYEMEVRAEIGQAQADMAKLIWQDAEVKFKRALVWEQIDAILGAPEVRFN